MCIFIYMSTYWREGMSAKIGAHGTLPRLYSSAQHWIAWIPLQIVKQTSAERMRIWVTLSVNLHQSKYKVISDHFVAIEVGIHILGRHVCMKTNNVTGIICV